jgi:hypothetical protein
MLHLLLAIAQAGAPSAPQLSVSSNDIAAGNSLSYDLSYADPGTPVWLVATGTRPGRGACPAAVRGQCFSYGPGYTVIGRGTTDSNGAWSGDLNLPDTLQSGGRALQVVASFGGSLAMTNAEVLTFHPYCEPDAWEGDDTQDLATWSDPFGIQGSLLVCEGDEDWVAVDVPDGARAVAWWTHAPDEGELEVWFYASAGLGTYFVGGDTTNGMAKRSWTNNEGADATVWFRTRVTADFANAGVPYTLRWDVESVDPDDCDEDMFEDNDTRENATPLAAGVYGDLTSCGDFSAVDEDYYAVDLLAGDVLDVDVMFTHADGDIDIDLRDESGAVLASSGGSADGESLAWVALADGTYTVHVGLYQDGIAGPMAEGAPYDMVVDITRP